MSSCSFYDRLCPPCADLNFSKRNLRVDLTGRTFLLTGCRVKIGFHCGLKLLRNGARVIGTSRFPRDAALRYMHEADFNDWASRLHVYGLDFRSISSVEAFAAHIKSVGGAMVSDQERERGLVQERLVGVGVVDLWW